MLMHEAETPAQIITVLLQRYYETLLRDVDDWSQGNEKQDRALYAVARSEVEGYIDYIERTLHINIPRLFLTNQFSDEDQLKLEQVVQHLYTVK